MSGQRNGSALFSPLEPRTLLAFTFPDSVAGPPGQLPFDEWTFSDRVVAADFDGDTRADLAFADDRRIAFLKGRGDGTFQDPVYTTLGTRVGRLALGHDADGTPVLFSLGGVGSPYPVVYPDTTYRGVVVRRILFDAGQSRFEVAAQRHVARNDLPRDVSRSMTVADFTGDGRADVVINFQKITLLRSTDDDHLVVTRVFGTAPGLEWTTTITAADLNADGRPDLVVQSIAIDRTPPIRPRVFLSTSNNPTGLRLNPITLALDGRQDWRFEDINADGLTDAVSLIRTSPPPYRYSIPDPATFQVRVRLATRAATEDGTNFLAPGVSGGSFSIEAGDVPRIGGYRFGEVNESIEYRLVHSLDGGNDSGFGVLVERSVSHLSNYSGDLTYTVSLTGLSSVSVTAPQIGGPAFFARFAPGTPPPHLVAIRLQSPLIDVNGDGLVDSIQLASDGSILVFRGGVS